MTGTDWQSANRMFLADVSGDGSADLIATRGNGEMIYCPNNASSNPNGRPFLGCDLVGSGWDTADRIFVADLSGDGAADILSTTPDGELRYFPNNAASNPDHKPFTGYTVVGTGWQTANRMYVADVSGDGAADILSTTADGELRYFPNNAGSNPDHKPFAGYTVVGTGWNTANRIFVSDYSGDGAADLLSTTPDGELRYFPNNAASNPDHKPFSGYKVTGTG
ncbi:FG-GAP-like repeat-containing protein, partial [Lentzea flava]|uniref:FG-GAP-like repeat-containing protein n=1 Tax=Lentzea flava TaxID=103732 RepID=UPI001671599C